MQAVILAAGQSSRFWPLNQKHKSLFKIMGKPLILHTLESLKRKGVSDVIVIQGPKKDVEKELAKIQPKGLRMKYVVQKIPKGMGDALWQARSLLEDRFFLLHGHHSDIDFFTEPMMKKQARSGADLVLLGKKVNMPWKYGIVGTDKNIRDKAVRLVEKPRPGEEPSDIGIIGIYLLPKNLLDYYKRVKNYEYDFEDTLQLYMGEKDARIMLTEKEVSSLKFPWEMFGLARKLMDRFLKPGIAGTAAVAKNVRIEGRVFAGDGVRIFENAVVKGPCYIGAGSVVGNNALLREYANIGRDCLLGTNLEMARTILGDGVHFHSGFIGDSVFGDGCVVGAGTVTANTRLDHGEIKAAVKGEKIPTGLKSLGAIVGAKAKFGINSSLMPGVMIGAHSIVGPGSVVRENIGDNAVFYPGSGF